MTIKGIRQSFLRAKDTFPKRSLATKFFIVTALALTLTINVIPVVAVSKPSHEYNGPGLQAASTLIITAEADARVEERNPTTNAGSSDYLEAVRATNRDVESYLRFTVSGTSGVIQTVRLRVYCTTDATKNGPAVYATGNTWTETGITWNNRPPRTSGAADNKGAIAKNAWVEYDVTALVTGNGTYSFVLAGDSSDSVRFSSREGAQPPQLVITFSSSTNTPTVSRTSAPTFTRTPTQTATLPSGSTPTTTRTSTPGTTPVNSPTSVSSSFIFIAGADSYVDSSNPATNYGSATTLRVDGSPDVRSYLRFNLQGLAGSVTKATLRVYANSPASAGYDVHSVSDNTWLESAITYNNAPAIGTVLGSSGSVSGGTWTNVDITPYITGNGTYNLALTTAGSTAISLASRESGTNAPQLVVNIQGGAAATSTVTRTPTPTTTRTPTSTMNPIQTATMTRTATPTSTASSGSVVLVGAGDISTCNNNNDEATAKLLDTISGTVFTAGDNAYDSGTYTEYINCYDPTWGRHKSRTEPVPGNHEYATSGAAGYFQYFNNIPAYYAYSLGAWRIYALNSEIDVSASGPQATWLQSDLAAHPSQCVLAYWHRARWSSGSTHGSTSSMQAIWQILYNAGAELVISGHEHNYERFAEMNASGAATSPGLREIVVGTGGMSLYPFGTPLSTSQVRSNSSYGVLKLTLRAGGYDWKFVPVAGSSFTDSGSGTCH